ncbi:DNA-binding MarR family transcriptional regulator [Ruminiclostridium sufflavum DSM 19573]|uniref:DNA-binding MarR family transcriptional regulator n=1 Tax=Ruminiclostridium sufflavum DSM 19573 TaxID=1121337 RepID=A0A318YBD9_9FIRM|nr:MarR family transcriptional regulator [Ruminiclostridium sufflavum]PYG89871.1 DNA-binding MarR family transcriptional regulator [Ruminiclostridium sufflavum DSM 19573]
MNNLGTEKAIISLFEIFPMCQKIILNSIDIKHLNFTKTQLFILFALMGKPCLNMSQIAAYIASSHEQATRAVAPLVKSGCVERFCDESNRKLVLIRLTDTGRNFISFEKEQLKKNLVSLLNTLTNEEKEEFNNATCTTLKILKKLE